MPTNRIRAATAAELPVLQDIERSAGTAFAGLGMNAVAEDDPASLDTLERYRVGGRAWVVADGADQPVGYSLTDLVDGATHLEQVSVHAEHARRGLGSALIEDVVARAAASGSPAVTLYTFADVPWNAPYYRRLGFRVLAPAEITPGLAALRRTEAQLGLDRWPRV